MKKENCNTEEAGFHAIELVWENSYTVMLRKIHMSISTYPPLSNGPCVIYRL